MKILKIFGVVVGIHVFALALIFLNPGCSSTNKPAPSPDDTVAKTDNAPVPISSTTPMPGTNQPYVSPSTDSPVSAVPPGFDPSAPAGPVVRFSPTRPGTPAAATLEAQPVADVTPASTYTVAKGDSLWTIAKKHHITVAELASINNLKAGATVRVGQKLIIPGKAVSHGASTATAEATTSKTTAGKSAAADTPAPARAAGESVKHVVKPGETLGAIARKYQVKVGEVATANNITDPAKIRPGMELTIPGWQAPAGKASKTPARSNAETPPPASDSPVQPAPQQDLDSGLKNNEPPVIKIEDPSAPTKA